MDDAFLSDVKYEWLRLEKVYEYGMGGYEKLAARRGVALTPSVPSIMLGYTSSRVYTRVTWTRDETKHVR